MPEPMKFYYFNVHAKGLGPALALEMSGLPWQGPKDMGWNTDEGWPALKASGKCPFGQLPLLIDGGLNIGQTCAILNYIGKKAKMEGETEADYVISQALLIEGEDLYNALQDFQPTTGRKLGERSPYLPKSKGDLAANKEWWADCVPGHMEKLEALLAGKDKFTTGKKFAVGEIHVWAMLHQMKFCNEKLFDGKPALNSFYKKMLNDASVQKVLKGESSFGAWDVPYFIPAEELSKSKL